MSWLDQVPVSTDAYAFQADLLCEDCGRAARDALQKRGVSDDGDSGTFPQGPYGDGGGESDSANFCGSGRDCESAVKVADHKVGCPLGNPLTEYGAESVRESVAENMFSRRKYSRMIGRLLRKVWGDHLDPRPARVKSRYADALPDSLLRRCKQYRQTSRGSRGFHSEIYADLDCAYLVYEHASVFDLCRAEAGDDGEFADFQVAQLPAEAARGRSLEEVVVAAVDEGAWD